MRVQQQNSSINQSSRSGTYATLNYSSANLDAGNKTCLYSLCCMASLISYIRDSHKDLVSGYTGSAEWLPVLSVFIMVKGSLSSKIMASDNRPLATCRLRRLIGRRPSPARQDALHNPTSPQHLPGGLPMPCVPASFCIRPHSMIVGISRPPSDMGSSSSAPIAPALPAGSVILNPYNTERPPDD